MFLGFFDFLLRSFSLLLGVLKIGILIKLIIFLCWNIFCYKRCIYNKICIYNKSCIYDVLVVIGIIMFKIILNCWFEYVFDWSFFILWDLLYSKICLE